ncbi:hypothetical protein RRG08_021302 [Elysia crispata]|uniref:Uncharacterized protein n=1 Tax=Elysia crispata TaxID=231223 RepID=A0AAE0ZA14_9GAST|nr:hypothetical protein RRG08_021302 [Elysia crispata]
MVNDPMKGWSEFPISRVQSREAKTNKAILTSGFIFDLESPLVPPSGVALRDQGEQPEREKASFQQIIS